MSQATWADPTATWASTDYAWDGTFLGTSTAATTAAGGGRRGPYRPLPDLELEDEEILLLIA